MGGWRSLCVRRRAGGTGDAHCSTRTWEDFADRLVGRGRESERDINTVQEVLHHSKQYTIVQGGYQRGHTKEDTRYMKHTAAIYGRCMYRFLLWSKGITMAVFNNRRQPLRPEKHCIHSSIPSGTPHLIRKQACCSAQIIHTHTHSATNFHQTRGKRGRVPRESTKDVQVQSRGVQQYRRIHGIYAKALIHWE